MHECENPRELPGFLKKSFCLPFGGGEIWFEHLDGLGEHSDLALEKLMADQPMFSRPSQTSLIGIVLYETAVTDRIIDAIANALLHTAKHFCRVCFIGADRKSAFRKALFEKNFALAFLDDFEKAKEWLILETE